MVFKNHIHINISLYSYSQIKQTYFYIQQNRLFMYVIKIIFHEYLMFKYEIIVYSSYYIIMINMSVWYIFIFFLIKIKKIFYQETLVFHKTIL